MTDYRSAENEEYEEEERKETTVQHPPTKTGQEQTSGGSWGSHFEYKEKPKQKVEYEYIPDEEYEGGEDYEEDGRGSSRVKRQARKGSKKGPKTDAPRTVATDGRTEKARFIDLKNAVEKSKAAGGATEYQGPLSRASMDCTALRCTHIECDLYGIQEGEYVLVEVFARMATNTLVEEQIFDGDVSSLALVRVTSTKFNWPHKPTLVTAVSLPLKGRQSDKL